MKLLSNPLSPLAPYATAIKLIGGAIIGLALIALVWSWHSRGQQIETMQAQMEPIIAAATTATVPPGKNGKRKDLLPSQIPGAIEGLARSYASAQRALDDINADAAKRKAASDAADASLANTIDKMQQDAKGDPAEWDAWK